MNGFSYGLRSTAYRTRELSSPVIGGAAVHGAGLAGYGISQALVGGVAVWAIVYAVSTVFGPADIKRFGMSLRGMPMMMPPYMGMQAPKPRKEKAPRVSRLSRFGTRQQERLDAMRTHAGDIAEARVTELLLEVAALGEANLAEIRRDAKLRWLRRRTLNHQLAHAQRLSAALSHVGRYDSMTPLLTRQALAALERLAQIMRQDKAELMERAQGQLRIEAERTWNLSEPFRPRRAWADFCEAIRISGLGGDLTAAVRSRLGQGFSRVPNRNDSEAERAVPTLRSVAEERPALNSQSTDSSADTAVALRKA